VSLTKRFGGKPWENSSGLDTSSSTLPTRLALPASSSAAIDPAPAVA
jgi:hypothetical protein